LAQVLVIDDNPMILQMLTDALSIAGHQVTTATNGWEALKQFRPAAHELVITDVFMPQVDGKDLLRVLRREIPKIPVIAITAGVAGDNEQMLEALKQLGANQVLQKPFTNDQLIAAVEACLQATTAPRR
jgi:DNA-binding response OmpR family regulator